MPTPDTSQTRKVDYHILVVRPPEFIWSDCFLESANALCSALRELGYITTIQENALHPTASNIVFGAHLLRKDLALGLPPSSIIYSLEQLGSSATPDWYMELAAHFQIWDYSPVNLPVWQQHPCRFPPLLMRVGFAPVLACIAPVPAQDIDVLFYGAVNERRGTILDGLRSAGLQVTAVSGVFGAERDALIARAKIVLNLHSYNTKIFEMVRVSYLLANAKAVVSEFASDMGEFADAVAVFPYERLVEGCVALVHNETERRALEVRGQRLFCSPQHRQAEIVKQVLGTASARRASFANSDLVLAE